MQLGFVSAILPDVPLPQLLQFAASEGFACVELMCWPLGKAERRYAGVTHIDVESFDPDEVHGTMKRQGLTISSLAYYPNHLHPDDEHREQVNGHLRKVIDAAQRLGVEVVGTFVGTPSMVLFCGASTYALGKVFVQHFESGGTFLDFEPAKVKEYFQKEFENGQAVAAKMKAEEKADVAV
jgi:sugar phosphate isomerase/epimerase